MKTYIKVSDLPNKRRFPEKLFVEIEEACYDVTPPWMVLERECFKEFAGAGGMFEDSPKRQKQCLDLYNFLLKHDISLVIGSRNP